MGLALDNARLYHETLAGLDRLQQVLDVEQQEGRSRSAAGRARASTFTVRLPLAIEQRGPSVGEGEPAPVPSGDRDLPRDTPSGPG